MEKVRLQQDFERFGADSNPAVAMQGSATRHVPDAAGRQDWIGCGWLPQDGRRGGEPAAQDSGPFKPVESGFDPLEGLDGENVLAGPVPELFGEAMMAEISPVLARFFGLESGDIQAWVPQHNLFSSRYVFVTGKPAALQSINRQMMKAQANFSQGWEATPTADATLAVAGPGAAPDQEQVIWRGRVPVMGGQTTRLQNLVWPQITEGSEPLPGSRRRRRSGKNPGYPLPGN